jgi:PAS domain S-box-containing protein
LIGAYRDNEVLAAHPLNALRLRLQQAGTPQAWLEMPPLNLLQINQLLADTLDCDSAEAQGLAAAVLQKTEGNPLFIWEFLQSLQAAGLLWHEPPLPGASGGWQWRLPAIEAHGISAGMAALLAEKFQRLRGSSRELVELAACIGMQFELFLLAEAHAKTLRDTLAALWECINIGLIVPVDTAATMGAASLQDSRAHLRFSYRFAHDHIHQTLLGLLDVDKQQRIYCRLAKLLLDQFAGQQPSDQTLFNIVHYFGRCGGFYTQTIGWEELARLRLQAAIKAKASASHEPALEWLRAGLALLPADAWQRHYDLALTLHSECAEAAYLCRDFAETGQQVEEVVRQARGILDPVAAYEAAILAAIAQNQLATAVNLGLQALARLGERFPPRPSKLHLALEYGRVRWALLGKRPGELRQSAAMSEPAKIAAMRILSLAGSAAYLAAPELLAMFTFRQVRLSARYGNSDVSAHAYAAYALFLCGILGDIEAGNRIGALALELAEQADSRTHHARVLHIVHTCVLPWKKPYAELGGGLLAAHASAVENGDLEFAMYALHVHAFYHYRNGAALSETAALTEGYSAQMARFQQDVAWNLNAILLQMQHNWMGDSADPLILHGRAYDRAALLPRHEAENQRGALFSLYFYEAMLSFHWEQHERALERLQQAAPYLDGLTGSPLLAYFHFYNGLCRLALPPRREHRKAVQIARRRLKIWARHAPANFLHLSTLLEAEFQAAAGKPAMPLYQQAIEQARQTGYSHEEALACELAGRFYQRRNQSVAAHMALQEAWNAYARWGAQAKLRQLERRYPWLLAGQSAGMAAAPPLDLQTVLKASQAIASEIVLDRLLEKLLKIALENAGARRGCLFLKHNEGWTLRAIATPEQARLLPQPGLALDQASGEAPASVVYYAARAAAPLVLAEAGQQEPFSHDPYIKASAARSLLCLPLLKQGGFDAILLLENNLSGGVFTPARLEILKMLSGQMATALENAGLYAELRGLTLSLHQEIRERRLAEAALRENQARLQLILDMLPLATIISRRDDGQILYANPYAATALGVTLEEILSLRTPELYANPEDRQKLLALLQQHGRLDGQEVLLKPYGRVMWVEAFAQPMRFNNEDAFIIAMHDITARK